MKIRSLIKFALLASVAPLALSTSAFAAGAAGGVNGVLNTGTSSGPVTEAGETIGLGLGAALPQGIYFVDTSSIVHSEGASGGAGKNLDVLVNIPVLAWSTPWDLLGGHVEMYGALPEAALEERTNAGNTFAAGIGSSVASNGMYNPAFLIGEAWALPYHLHFSNFIGGYAPVGSQAGFAGANATNNVWTFNERFALTYLNDGWNGTVHGIWGTSTKDTSSHDYNNYNGNYGGTVAGTACSVQACQRADYLNLDVTLVKTLGKWTVGPVGYYTGDTSRTSDQLQGNREIAAGAFAGYAFGGINVETYLTHDLVASLGHLTGGEDTRFFLRFVAPLY